MYCWVIVEPPPCTSPLVTMAHAARAIPRGEMPESSQKVRFSAATTASLTVSGISAREMLCLFCTARLPIFVSPSA